MSWNVLFHSAFEIEFVAFAFDPQRQAILLVAGNKQGKNQKQFYQNLIRTADARFSEYLQAKEKK